MYQWIFSWENLDQQESSEEVNRIKVIFLEMPEQVIEINNSYYLDFKIISLYRYLRADFIAPHIYLLCDQNKVVLI